MNAIVVTPKIDENRIMSPSFGDPVLSHSLVVHVITLSFIPGYLFMVFLYAYNRLPEGKNTVLWRFLYVAGDATHTLIAMLRTKVGQRLDRWSLPLNLTWQACDCIVSKSDRHQLELGNNLSINSCLSSPPYQ